METCMNAIAVVDENWGLGKDGKLLVHLSGDLRYFKGKTLGKTIIIGRETFEGMSGRILPGRDTVVLSRNPHFKADCPVCHSLEETFGFLREKPGDELFVAGGEAVYRLFFPYCGRFYITKIFDAFEADRFFPNLDAEPERFTAFKSGEVMEENGVRYQFFEYVRTR